VSLINTIKPQTREETIRINAEVDEIVKKVNQEVKESMEITREYIKRSLTGAKY
jgi:hypothetical protein